MDFLLELNWLAVGQIILIDILLGGDNAIVIALACRNLPPRQGEDDHTALCFISADNRAAMRDSILTLAGDA